MLVKGIHHISLTCTSENQYKETIHFYHQILGLEIWKEWPKGIMLKTGMDVVEVFLKEEQPDLNQGAIRHFAFATEDVNACVQAVCLAGYSVTVEPKNVEIASTPVYSARVAFCIGPVGEEIEFFQER